MELFQPTGQNNNDTSSNFTGSALVDFGTNLGGGAANTGSGGGSTTGGGGGGGGSATTSALFTFR